AENRVAGEPVFQELLEYGYLVDSFARVNSGAEKILVHVRYGVRVDVVIRIPGKNRGQARTPRGFDADGHAGLEDVVPFGHLIADMIDYVTIEMISESSDEFARRTRKQLRILIESDDVADFRQYGKIPGLDGKAIRLVQ